MYGYTAFDESFTAIAQGSLEDVALEVKKQLKSKKEASALVFSDLTGRQIDLDLSGSEKDVRERLKMFVYKAPEVSRTAGRPKLGVVAREVSLLPSHWEWLLNQDGGASLMIRRLIDEKIKLTTANKDKTKIAQEATYKFLSALAGNLPNFEEVIRYLYRKDKKKFQDLMKEWPQDVAEHASKMAVPVFAD